MDKITYCRAMAVFCRQRAQFENEDTSFWTKEAEGWDNVDKAVLQSGPHQNGQSANPITNALG